MHRGDTEDVPLADELVGSEFRTGVEGVEFGADYPFLEDDDALIQLTRECCRASDQYFDTGHRRRIEDAWARFRSKHPAGSKFNTELYAKRSRIFHPATRAKMRKLEAAAAVAFFSTQDAVNCQAVNDSDEDQRDGAELHNALLEYRLVTQPKMKQGGIKWFQFLIGGVQDALNTGIVISRQTWRYEKRKRKYNERSATRDPQTGEFTTAVVEREEVISDQPECALVPVENFKISPAADWADPVGTSPYLIEMRPMYVDEVRRKMNAINPITGETEYRQIADGLLGSYCKGDYESIRQAREGNKGNRFAAESVGPYDIAWVYHHIIRFDDGCDYCYDTLGEQMMLSWGPRPLEEVYAHAIRPYSIGCSVLEAHNLYPEGPNDLMRQIQEQRNDLGNLKLDNIKLAVNPRYLLRRGASVNARALMQNVPSGVLYVGHTENDVKLLQQHQIPQAVFIEDNMLSLESDEITGNMSQGTVGSSKELGNTVGGMNLLATDANEVKEYTIRTISESWLEDVVRQLVLLNSVYETSKTVFKVVGDKLNMTLERILKIIRNVPMVTVNVGFGATNPIKRIERLAVGLKTLAAIAPRLLEQLDEGEAVKEIFGALGYKDGTRFFPQLKKGQQGADPQVEQLKQQVAELQQLVDGKQMENQAKIQVAQISAQAGIDRAMVDQQTKLLLAQYVKDASDMKHRLDELDRMLQADLNEIKRRELILEREALSHSIQQADRDFMLQMHGERKAELQGTTPADMKGPDKAGTLARDKYGPMPQSLAAQV